MLVLLLAVLSLVSGEDDFHPLLNDGESDVGVKLRVGREGLAYLNRIASNLLADQLPRLLIPNIEQRLPNNQGLIEINRIRVSRFRRAREHNISTSEPNRFSWKVKDMDIGLIGDLSGRVEIVVPFELEGQVEILTEGLTFHLESEVDISEDGPAIITTSSCHTTISRVQVFNHNGGLFGLAVNVFKQAVSSNVRTALQKQICRHVTKYIDQDLNEQLAKVQTKSALAEAVSLNAIRSHPSLTVNMGEGGGGLNLASFFGERFGSEFFIDYRLRDAPRCELDMVELSSAGEISYRGAGGTPFMPTELTWPSRQPKSMLEVVVADYLPNSLFYHAFKQHLIRLQLNGNTPGVAPFLRTECEGSFCLSDILPQLAETYPNSTLDIVFTASRAPAVIFSSKDGGVMSLHLSGVIVVYVDQPRDTVDQPSNPPTLPSRSKKQAAVIDLEVVADAVISVKNNTIMGTVRLNKFDLTRRFGDIEISSDELTDISLLGSQLIENMINEMLAKGFPIPLPNVLHLSDISVEFGQRQLLIRTDFAIDEKRLATIAEATILKGLPFAPHRLPTPHARFAPPPQPSWPVQSGTVQQRVSRPIVPHTSPDAAPQFG